MYIACIDEYWKQPYRIRCQHRKCRYTNCRDFLKVPGYQNAIGAIGLYPAGSAMRFIHTHYSIAFLSTGDSIRSAFIRSFESAFFKINSIGNSVEIGR